jgi:uncharacterized protein YmfQ (DUF2313 family)
LSRDPATVLAELLAISPPGVGMLLQNADTNWAQFLAPLAAEISRFEGFADEMLIEVDPGAAEYLLPDYQRVLGPDPYGRDAIALTLSDQQALALSRWTQKWGVTIDDFIGIAATFGIAITIQEYTLTTSGCECGVLLVGHPTEFAWLVNMPAVAVEYPQAGGASAGDLLGSFAPSLAQPVIAGRAPAHTNPYFSYAS